MIAFFELFGPPLSTKILELCELSMFSNLTNRLVLCLELSWPQIYVCEGIYSINQSGKHINPINEGLVEQNKVKLGVKLPKLVFVSEVYK